MAVGLGVRRFCGVSVPGILGGAQVHGPDELSNRSMLPKSPGLDNDLQPAYLWLSQVRLLFGPALSDSAFLGPGQDPIRDTSSVHYWISGMSGLRLGLKRG